MVASRLDASDRPPPRESHLKLHPASSDACVRLDPQDNSEVHFKVKMTTKFEKVRARRVPDRDRVLCPSTPRPSETTAEHVADRRLRRSRFLPARSSTPSARARRCSPTPCASCSTARESTPTRPLRTYVPRPDPPRASPRALPRANQIAKGATNLGAQKRPSREPKSFFSRPIASASRENLTSPPLSRAARHGGRRLHRRDDGAGRRTLSARDDRGVRSARLRGGREETRFSSASLLCETR